MERGGPFFPSGQSAASSGSNLVEGDNPPDNIEDPINPNNNDERRVLGTREPDQYMPMANVIRIMRQILPSHAKISDDAKETVQECVSEYISFITNEANERCRREQRRTVTVEDVLWAMDKLGFDNYVQPLTAFLNRHRESDGNRSAGGLGGGSSSNGPAKFEPYAHLKRDRI